MICLEPMPFVSPSLAETARCCLLAAGLSRCTAAGDYVLGNPKAWLGTAYHAALAALAGAGRGANSTRELVDHNWNAAIAALESRAMAHPLNQRFGPALTWPGYQLTLAMVHLRAEELALPAAASREGSREGGRAAESREHSLVACAGRLRGRPDLVRDGELIDFKTGSIYDHLAGGDDHGALNPACVRQLRIYAYLVHSATGCWPSRGLLVPMAGRPEVVELTPPECQVEVNEALRLLDAYNTGLARATEPWEMASPSPEACRWCSFKTICLAFWRSVDQSWAEVLDGEYATGLLPESPRRTHGGLALAVRLAVEAGTVPEQILDLASLSAAVHTSLLEALPGDSLRVLRLRRRDNRTLMPRLETVFLLDRLVPGIEMVSA